MNILEDIVTLRIVAEEPSGPVEHVVRPMVLTIENMRQFWLRAREHRTLFGEEIVDDFSKFINRLVVDGPDGIATTGLFWIIDDFTGVFYLTEIEPEVDALVHYSFFDGRHRGRVEMTKAMIRFVFKKYGFRRLTASIPLYSSPVASKFVEQVGFQREGQKRHAVRYKDSWFHVNYYGLLREEALNDSA